MISRLFIFLVVAGGCASAAESETTSQGTAVSPLDQAAHAFTAVEMPIQQAFYLIGRSYNVPFVLDPELKGNVTLDVPAGGMVRQLVEAITYPRDLYYEESGGHVLIQCQQTEFLELAAPANTRTSSSSTNIALAASSTGSLNNAVNAVIPGAPQTTTTSLPGQYGSANGGESNITVTEKNDNPFWDLIRADLKEFALPTEKLILNPNSGMLIVTASPRRLLKYRHYVAVTNERLTRQVDIEVKIVEVTLNRQHEQGIDVALQAARIGDVSVSGGLTTGISAVGPTALSPTTIGANFSTSRVNVFLHALEEQGEVRDIAKPQVRVMNNQTAYLVVGREQGFFTLSATQQITNGQTSVTGAESAIYTKETLTFGTVFSVTVGIPTPDTCILDVKPERSTLVRIETSADNRQKTPVTDVQKAGTRLALRDGETTVLAGLSSTTTGTQMRGVPVMSKVPVLGALFRSDASTDSKSELVIIITAKIVRGAAGAVATTR